MSLFNGLFGRNRLEAGPRINTEAWKDLVYNDICIALSKQLRRYREVYDLSQKELADILGCNKSLISNLEAARIDDISIRMLIDLCTRLSTEDYNFGDGLINDVHKVVNIDYEQLNQRRFGK